MIDVSALRAINNVALAKWVKWYARPHELIIKYGGYPMAKTVNSSKERMIKLAPAEVADLLEVIRAVKEADRSSEFLNGWSLEVLTDFERQLEAVK